MVTMEGQWSRFVSIVDYAQIGRKSMIQSYNMGVLPLLDIMPLVFLALVKL